MAITNYTTLQSTIADYLARTDLSAQIPTFIQLCENRLRRDLRLRNMLKVSTTTTTIGQPKVELPTDFIAMRDMHINTTPIQALNYYSPSNLNRDTYAYTKALPRGYTILASEIQLSPIPDSVYTLELLYYAAPDYLSSTNPSNVFLAIAPDLLLYGSLAEAEPYLMNDDRIQTWAGLYQKGLDSLSASDDAGEFASVPMTIQIAKR
jgi:hypothetical protein